MSPMRPLTHTALLKRANPRPTHMSAQQQAARTFYGSTCWQKVRRLVLQRDPLCKLCSTESNPVAATLADHILEYATHPHLALDLDNLRGVCTACHNRRHHSGSRQ